MRAVAVALGQRLGDRQALELVHRQPGRDRAGTDLRHRLLGDALGQVIFGEQFAIGEHHHALQRVPQLADVAGPAVGHEPPHHLGADALAGGVF